MYIRLIMNECFHYHLSLTNEEHVVDKIEDMEEFLPARFYADLKTSSNDPNAAITFVVLANAGDSDSDWWFPDYYD
jgi:hypothetical protein